MFSFICYFSQLAHNPILQEKHTKNAVTHVYLYAYTMTGEWDNKQTALVILVSKSQQQADTQLMSAPVYISIISRTAWKKKSYLREDLKDERVLDDPTL